jgi:hypothetical protein
MFMRLALVVVVALAGCTETGAHLTFSAPEGPRTAAAFSIILAAPGDIATISNQRVALADRRIQTVSYYRQRTTAGEVRQAINQVDGFRVRIAPDAEVTDTDFIPFILIQDGQGQLVGIGTYRYGDSHEPRSIEVRRDEIGMYTLHVEPVVEVTDMDTTGPGQVQVVECERGDEMFQSGVVWRPLGGGELRIVLPADGDDATGRALDLDCDDHAVTPDDASADCDDTRNWFHRGAEEACDGHDTNCDGADTIALPCDSQVCPALAGVQTGVALCDDATGTSAACQPTASCACASSTTSIYTCNYCELPWATGSAAGAFRPCQPTQGIVKVYGHCSDLAPCTIEIAGTRNGWLAEIARDATQPFGHVAEDVTNQFVLKVKHPDGATHEVQSSPGGPLGDIDFIYRTATSTRYVGLQLRLLEEQPAQASCPSVPAMRCFP